MHPLRAASVIATPLLAAAALAPAANATTLAAIMFPPLPLGTPRVVATFDSATPGTIATSVPLTGVPETETVLGIDRSPRDGKLYLVTREASNAGRIYVLDPFTGAAGAPLPLVADPTDATAPYTDLSGASSADVDVDPVTGAVRLVLGNRTNMRIDPANGRVTTDTNLTGANTFNAIAYSNNFASTASTTLYAYNYTTDNLSTVNPPNSGMVSNVGPSGFVGQNTTPFGLDVAPDGTMYQSARSTNAQRLYVTNAATGAATPVGLIGDGTRDAGDFAVLPNLVEVTTTAVKAVEGGPATIRLHRTGPHAFTRVDWTATAGTAGADDFTAAGTATFAPGATDLDVEVPITDDALDEPAETFTVTFAPSTDPSTLDGLALMKPERTATVTIGDNDVATVPPPAPPTPPAPDTTKPFVYVVQPATLRLATFTRSGLVVLSTTSEQVTGRAELRLGTKLVATAPVATKGAALVTRRLKPTAAGAKLLAAVSPRVKRIKLTLSVVVKDVAGNATTTKRAVVLVR